MSGDTSERPPVLTEELKSEIRDTIADAQRWRLPETRWAAVADQMAALHDALGAGDVAAVMAALGELERAAPLRITPLGRVPPVSATAKVRDLARRVVFDLGEGLAPDRRDRVDGRHERGQDGVSHAAGG